MSAKESGDADESMNMVKLGTEAWRQIHSRYTQNTTQKISGSLLHDHADKYKQLPDESPDESKEHKHTDNQRHELQPLNIRSLDEYRTKFVTNTMRSRRPWRIYRSCNETELEEKAGNEQQWRRELSMVAQEYDAKHGDGNSRQVAYQEDDNLKLQNENIQEYKELHEQIQAYLDQKFKQDLDRMAQDAYRERNTALRSQFAIDLWFSWRKDTDLSRSWHAGWKQLGISRREYFTCHRWSIWKLSCEGEAEVGPTSQRARRKLHSGSSRDVFCFFATRTQSWG